jgi:hypothetical protein
MRSSNSLATSFSLSNCSNVRDSPWGVGYILLSMGEHQRYLISTQQSVVSLLSTVRYTFPPKCSITLEYLLFLICSTASSTSSKYVSSQGITGSHSRSEYDPSLALMLVIESDVPPNSTQELDNGLLASSEVSA